MGNILTKSDVQKINLKQHGGSTLGGRKVWFDRAVLKLNYEERGEYLGEFNSQDRVLVVTTGGEFYTTSFDSSVHFNDDVMRIEKFEPHKIWTALLHDADQNGYLYLKRFQFEAANKKQSYLGDNPENSLVLLTDDQLPRFEITFGGGDAYRQHVIVDAEEFIAVKSFKAKGKRVTTFEVARVNALAPREQTEDNEGDDAPVETGEETDIKLSFDDPDLD